MANKGDAVSFRCVFGMCHGLLVRIHNFHEWSIQSLGESNNVTLSPSTWIVVDFPIDCKFQSGISPNIKFITEFLLFRAFNLWKLQRGEICETDRCMLIVAVEEFSG